MIFEFHLTCSHFPDEEQCRIRSRRLIILMKLKSGHRLIFFFSWSSMILFSFEFHDSFVSVLFRIQWSSKTTEKGNFSQAALRIHGLLHKTKPSRLCESGSAWNIGERFKTSCQTDIQTAHIYIYIYILHQTAIRVLNTMTFLNPLLLHHSPRHNPLSVLRNFFPGLNDQVALKKRCCALLSRCDSVLPLSCTSVSENQTITSFT
jgi:hypothetical protein